MDKWAPAPGEGIDWQAISKGPLENLFVSMQKTPQNPAWHGEGNVLAHTQAVCEALVRLPAWRSLPDGKRETLFLSALLHDTGKTVCTRLEEGVWQSPRHGAVGAGMARSILWRDFGLCGTQEAMRFRESVCQLIRYHSLPQHISGQTDPERKLIQVAALPTAGFSLEMLAMLAEADVRGRISSDQAEKLEEVGFFFDLAAESGCLRAPFVFPDDYSRFAYLSGKNILPGQPLFNPTWGTVIMLSGLPGTGKDTYIRQHFAGLPMVSLDDQRYRLGIKPEGPQGVVITQARALAREYLRKKQVFVWNATNTTPLTRAKQVSLFSAYGAATKIIYLETSWQEMLARNGQRPAPVPESVISHLLEALIPPNACEAHSVEWINT